jgi:diguanylate cyclase (GGDEF)-like protein/PAS domain S-box-containing protein
MPIKPKSAVKSKSASKTKPAVKKKPKIKPNKKLNSQQNDFANLAEEIISNVCVGIYIVKNGKFVYVSPLFQKLSGYSLSDLLGTNPLDHVHPEDRETVRQKAINCLTGKCGSYEYRFVMKKGKIIWVMEMVTSITYQGKRATLGSFMDITEHKRREDELRRSEEKYRSILENIEDGYAELDLHGNFIFFNEALCKIQGYPREELIKKTYRDLMDEENAKKIFARYNKVYTTGESEKEVPYEIITKSGLRKHLETSITPMKDASGRIFAFRGIVRDVTERKQAEEVLRQSEEKYRTIIETIQDGYFETDLTGKFTFVNDAECNNLGYTREELIAMERAQYAGEKNRKLLINLFIEIYKTGIPVKAYNLEFTKKDGTTSYNEISVSLIRNSKGEPVGFRGIARDVTERKQAEEALQKSEERYRTILENMQEAYYEIDLTGKFTLVNDAVCRHLGYTREELIGINNRQFQDETIAKKMYQIFIEIYKTGEPVEAIESEYIRKDGTKGTYELSVSLIKDASGKPIGFRGISRDITERKQREEELALFRSAMDVSQDMIFLVDRSTMRFLYVNETACQVAGFTREEFMKSAPHEFLLVDIKVLERMYDETIAAGTAGITMEMKTRRKDGVRTIIELHRRALNIGNRWMIVTMTHDVSQRWLTDKKIRLLGRMFAALSTTNETILHSKSPEELYQRVCDAAVDGGKFITTGILLFDPGTTWVRVAAASGADTDKLREARISLDEAIPEGRGLVGTAFRTSKPCVSTDYLNDPVSQVWRENAKNVGSVAVVPLLKDGQVIGALIFYATEKRAFEGEIVKLLERMAENVVFALDNFEHEAKRKHGEERIQHMATHDALTGLPNRLMFSQLLNHAIQSAKRHQRQFAVFFIDLDRFKTINDTLGHEAGDLLLQEIAMRFKQTLRAADVVGRLGGDEFVILIEEVGDPSQVATVAHKILTAAIKPMVLLGEECRVTASIGISMYPKDAEDEQALMKNADIAMYLAKEEGKNNYQFYSEDIKTKSIERLSIETNLRFALERDELALHYQAKVDFKTNAITGVEALLRWQNPYLGSVTPMQFIPVAEESGLIIPIGRWVIRTACAQNVAWQREGLPPVCMAVNLSPRQLLDEFLIEDVKKALDDSGMAPHLLELEITESMVMHNPARMIAVLVKIKDLGVRLAIDDFGTGYSSLAQIKHFPIDTLKVDRSFIRNIPQDSEDKAITEAIIAMGKTLSLTVVAEGVETVEQMDFLKDHSCDEMQGFYFSKPIAPDQFADLLRKHIPTP